MKKWVSIIIETTLVLGTIVGVTIGGLALYDLARTPKTINNSSSLTQEVCNKNFQEDGIWHNKAFLTADDLRPYSVLSPDTFNSIEHPLEYIEIPNSMKLSNINPSTIGMYFKNPNIKEIRLEKNHTNLEIINNILFYKKSDLKVSYTAITISNRNQNIEIDFSISDEYYNIYRILNIPDNFYDDQLFSNVTKIKMDSLNFHVLNIGKNAFKNCKILSNQLSFSPRIDEDTNVFNLLFSLNVSNNAFENTNLSSLSVSNANVCIELSAFANNLLLENITFNNVMQVDIKENAFVTATISNRNISIIKNPNLPILNIFDNAFGGTYNNFSLEIVDMSESGCLYEFSSLSLANINAVNFRMSLPNEIKSMINNTGLTQDQINSIIWINQK